MLRADRLSFAHSLAPVPALRDVSFTLPNKGGLLVTGPSGGGKSTLLSLLAGLYPRFLRGDLKGSVSLDGESPETLVSWASKVGFMTQNPESQFIAGSVEDEIYLTLRCREIIGEEAGNLVEERLDLFRLREVKDNSVFKLSEGQKQKVVLAALTALKPKVLLLDEPSANLDPFSLEELGEALKLLREKDGISLVIADHRLHWLRDIVSEILVLDHGEVAEQGDWGRLSSRERRRELGLREIKTPRLSGFKEGRRERREKTAGPGEEEPEGNPEDNPRNNGQENGLDNPQDKPKDAGVGVKSSPRESSHPEGSHPGSSHPEGSSPPSQPSPPNPPSRPLPSPSSSSGILSSSGISSSSGIEIRKLFFHYRNGPELLRGMDAFIAKGKVTALIGPSGRGKTTLAKLLCGLEKPIKGEILVGGKPPDSALSQVVLQNADHQLYMSSALDEIMVALGGKKGRDEQRAMGILGLFGLSALADRHPQSLSGGEKQRLVVALGIARPAELLVLDEPTSGLDGRNLITMAEEIKKVARLGPAVLVISHDPELINLTADELLDMGEIMAGP